MQHDPAIWLGQSEKNFHAPLPDGRISVALHCAIAREEGGRWTKKKNFLKQIVFLDEHVGAGLDNDFSSTAEKQKNNREKLQPKKFLANQAIARTRITENYVLWFHSGHPKNKFPKKPGGETN